MHLRAIATPIPRSKMADQPFHFLSEEDSESVLLYRLVYNCQWY